MIALQVISLLGVVLLFVYMYVTSKNIVLQPEVHEEEHIYDSVYQKSVSIYAFQIIVRYYLKTGCRTACNKLLEWNSKYNNDPELLTKYGIIQANLDFQSILDESEQLGKKPTFGIDVTYDYNELPITMKNSSYCDTDTLLQVVHSLLEDNNVSNMVLE